MNSSNSGKEQLQFLKYESKKSKKVKVKGKQENDIKDDEVETQLYKDSEVSLEKSAYIFLIFLLFRLAFFMPIFLNDDI